MFSMIFVRMGLSLAWQNGSQNSSFLTTLRCNRPLAAPDPPQSHFMRPVRVNITTSVDESQSEGIILVRSQSNYKSNSLTGDSVYSSLFIDPQSFVNLLLSLKANLRVPILGCGGTLSGRDISTFPSRHYSSNISTRPFQRRQVSRRSFRCSFLASTRRRVVFHHLKFAFQVVHLMRDLPKLLRILLRSYPFGWRSAISAE